MKTYDVYFKSGLHPKIKAGKFALIDSQNAGLVLSFFSSDTDKIDDIFIPAQEVLCAAPEESIG